MEKEEKNKLYVHVNVQFVSEKVNISASSRHQETDMKVIDDAVNISKLTEHSRMSCTQRQNSVPVTLSPAEILILRQLLKGECVTDIARGFNKSVKTISHQKRSLYRKLGVRNDILLYPYLLNNGILEISDEDKSISIHNANSMVIRLGLLGYS